MSLDKSLKSKSTLARHRNVLTRAEKIEKLQEMGKWSDDMNVMGLPKVGHRKVSVGKKTKEKKTDGEGDVIATDDAVKTEDKKPS